MELTFLLTTFVTFTCSLALPHRRQSSNGPVISSNFQDPSVISAEGVFYAYSGPNGNPSVNVQIASSSDFTNWQLQSGVDALPDPGSWAASPAHVWAPDVNQLGDGQYVMYYCAATAANPSKHCIGAATGSSPDGTFTPTGYPLFCDISAGGAIDPNGAVDPQTSKQYVVYKVDGNSNGNGSPTPIMLQQVSTIDGTTLIGDSVTILLNEPEDGAYVEAPALTYDETTQSYVLFFNSGSFTSTDYKINYATASVITGPYTRKGTFLQTGSLNGAVNLPGGIDVSGDGTKAVVHGDTNLGWFSGDGSLRVRAMYAIDLDISGGTAFVGQVL